MRKLTKILACLVMLLVCSQQARGLSFALDSVAEWGKFPRFCVNVYRWGDKFFNSYDSTYVKGTGYKFNVKLKTESWTDFYNFNLPGNSDIIMTSDLSTTGGVYLTYLAVSGGYDINISNLFNGAQRTRSRFNFGFNCSLLAVEWYYVSNDVGTTIKRIGTPEGKFNTNIPFNGINTSEWALQTYYFFNHKRYSQAAAFNFSKLQQRSQGSFYAGLSIGNSRYDFDFSSLPSDIGFPDSWHGVYKASTYNYAFRLGYGYNWVFKKNWLLGVSESPVVGLRRGMINSHFDSGSFGLSNRFNLSVVWSTRRWFAGFAAKFDSNLIYDKDHSFVSSIITNEISAGYRFNIW